MVAIGDVSSLYWNGFHSFAAARGLHLPELPFVDSASDARRASATDFCRAVDAGVRASGDGLLGLRFGACVGGHALGLLGLAVASAATLAHSLQDLRRWHSLKSTLGAIEVQRSPSELGMTWRPHSAVPPAVADAILSGWVAFARFISGSTLPGIHLELAHAAPANGADAERVIGCPVRFATHAYRVVAPANLLDVASRFADEPLHAAIGQWLDHAVQALAPGRESVLQRIRHALLQALAEEGPSWDAVARRVGAGRRALQRQLAVHGLSFGRMRNAVRASIAIVELCVAREAHVDIAARIGYVEQASFSRMVTRWAGRSPRDLARRFGRDYGRLRLAGMPA